MQKETRKQIVLKTGNHRNIKKSLHTQFKLRFKPLFLSVLGSLELDPYFSEINIGKEKNPTTSSVAQDLNILMGFDLVYTQAY